MRQLVFRINCLIDKSVFKMKRSRGSVRKCLESSDSEDDLPLKRPSPDKKGDVDRPCSSSSESDIESYLQKPEKMNFDSEFFTAKPAKVPEFAHLEKNTSAGVGSLSNSESDTNDETSQLSSTSKTSEPASKQSFHQFQNYTKQMEEARKQVEIYKTKKQAQDRQIDIFNLLSIGEGTPAMESSLTAEDLHESDFESCDSEKEDWEEIKNLPQDQTRKNIVPSKGLQIVVDMPDAVKKKKGIDLVAAMKRRLNRIRKENQLLVHKVHLLCWIAHGNYVNSIINDTQTLALALSLLPSEQSYPSNRTDLSYLEQITAWYHKTVENIEKPVPNNMELANCLEKQINTKQAYNKKMLALIFVAILRSLGIQARVVMSLQVEPLRPPASDLHTLSTKTSTKPDSAKKQPVSAGSTSKAGIAAKQDSPKVKVAITIQKPTPVKTKQRQSKKKSMSGPKSVQTEARESKNQPEKCKNKGENPRKSAKEVLQSAKQSSTAEPQLKQENPAAKKHDKCAKMKQSDKQERAKSAGDGKNSKSQKSVKLETLKPQKRSVDVEKNNSKASVSGAKPKLANLKRGKASESRGSTIPGASTGQVPVEPVLKVPKKKKLASSAENLDVQPNEEQKPKPTRNLRPARRSKNVLQVDGLFDSESEPEVVTQDKRSSRSRPNLKLLKKDTSQGTKKPNLKTLNVARKTKSSDSDSEFEPNSSFSKRLSQASSDLAKLEKLKRPKSKPPDVKKEIVGLVKDRIAEQKQIARTRMVKKRRSNAPSDSDSDFAPEPVKKRHQDSGDNFTPKTKVKRRIPVKAEPEDKKKKQGCDVWVEVFLESEEKWISVDVVFGQVHCIKNIVQRATHPIAYVLAWDNNSNIKDVTQRYCPNFNTITRKLRISQKWWSDSIKPFQGVPTPRDREEDEDLARQQLDQPLPKVISEYKDHPLYALRRHLLKFEALYPPEPPTLGFVRGEAVYPRTCVYTLHSRDIWLKQAKVVRMGEQPYKIVKARPKWDKLSNKVITDQLLEIFGIWQVQDYEPPTAENGVVPRNAFGNVDLFKPCMLPKGCVHLRLPGLNKIARKMNVDCASAIVGFDFHGGWSHPCYDGFVVCKEYEDQLICAWDTEQEELDRKEQMQHDKRVYGNWKKLIRGLLIRERLKAKYDFGAPSTSASQSKRKPKKPTLCTKRA